MKKQRYTPHTILNHSVMVPKCTFMDIIRSSFLLKKKLVTKANREITMEDHEIVIH